jgi:glycosyltransferase involved in cell wall biosynthesis
MTRVAIVHDYLTQRGGAERVVLQMHNAFPEAPIFTSLYLPTATFPEFAAADIRTSSLNRIAILRNNHRLALPFLAMTFGRTRVEADVVVCSSSGWAHGVRVAGAKVVYFYTPARWLYQGDRYLGERSRIATAALALMRPHLIRWDKRAAATVDVALTSSRAVVRRLDAEYGLSADILPPPPGIDQSGPQSAIEGVAPGFWICVSRLLPYKNVKEVVKAFDLLPQERLVVVGKGPELEHLRAIARANVLVIGSTTDAQLRWLYASSVANVAASHEDFGLTPLEAASFGKPSAVLRWGGFLDTVREGVTGEFFDVPRSDHIAHAIERVRVHSWSASRLIEHANAYSAERFVQRLRDVVRHQSACT